MISFQVSRDYVGVTRSVGIGDYAGSVSYPAGMPARVKRFLAKRKDVIMAAGMAAIITMVLDSTRGTL